MANRSDGVRTSMGVDTLSRRVTRGVSGVNLVDSEEPRKPCQADTPGSGSMPTHRMSQ